MEKACKSCGEVKPLTEYHKNPTTADRRLAKCKPCVNKKSREKYHPARVAAGDKKPTENRGCWSSKLKSKFGITADIYDKMLADQGGVCKICKKTDSTGQRLAVDHCHSTNRVRGLLCRNCNTALGKFKDDTALLQNAIKYLND